jgi:ABC-2 type transport system ATP-binding protein
MSEILRLESVTKTFGTHTAIDHVSLTIQPQSILGLLGPNGAGKTTLLRLITQIVLPDSGRIFFNGNIIKETDRAGMGYLPEERGLYRKMRVQEQLVYFAQLRGMSVKDAKHSVTDWLQRLDIAHLQNQLLETLSKGQQQKVQFISAVLHQPQLLILDEPFSGFDPANAEVIKKEINALHKAGTTIIYSTHRMDTVEDLCTELILVHQAKVVLQGTPEKIRKQFDRGQIRLVYSGELPDSFQSLILEQKELSDGKKSYLLGADKNTKQLLTLLMERGTIHAFEEYLPSMHDIFLNVVNESKS